MTIRWNMKLEHVIRHLLLLFLFCAFLAEMVFSINNLLDQKVGVSIGIKESKIDEPAVTICPYNQTTKLPFSNLGNGTSFTMPSWIEGLWLTKNGNNSPTM
jgi:hypothetical protein